MEKIVLVTGVQNFSFARLVFNKSNTLAKLKFCTPVRGKILKVFKSLICD